MTINHLSPPYMWDFFTKKLVEYDFSTKQDCELPPVRSQRFCTELLEFRESLLWNCLNDEIKNVQSLAVFKQKIKAWNGTQGVCNICKC